MKSRFVYVTYIKTTPQALWKVLTSPKFMRQYWAGMAIETDWKKGSPWALKFSDGRTADSGEVVEFNPPKRLVLKWRNEWSAKLKKEGFSRCTYSIEKTSGAVKLTVIHEMNVKNSKFIEAVSGGWPFILSNIKSLLETGKVVLKETDRH